MIIRMQDYTNYSNGLLGSHSSWKGQSSILVSCIETDAHAAFLHKCPTLLGYWIGLGFDRT
jgi:hypothetical protein